MDLNLVIRSLFAKVNRFEPPEGATLRLMWHWHVITRRRPSQITGTLAVVIMTTVSRENVLQRTFQINNVAVNFMKMPTTLSPSRNVRRTRLLP
ncbi:hypothetical protein CWM66_18730 [Kosakonia sp. H7A]|nr:hypothetical protein CWM66_18730 [Kosakonia sp. H7A]